MLLKDECVIVTGAGRGLGRAYAIELAAQGALVIVNDIDAGVAEDTVAEIRRTGGNALPQVGDVGLPGTAEELVGLALGSFGRLDAVVANAGVTRDRSISKMTDEEFDLVIHIHLRGTFMLSRAAIRHFRESGTPGRVVLIGSPAGQRANFGQANYSAAKAGVVGMMRTLALETAGKGVTVNAVVPVALTRMVAGIPGRAELVAAVEQGADVPAELRRAGTGTPADVAPLISWLCSAEAADITGQCIGIGGDRISIWSHPSESAALLRRGGWGLHDIRSVFAPALRDAPADYRMSQIPAQEERASS